MKPDRLVALVAASLALLLHAAPAAATEDAAPAAPLPGAPPPAAPAAEHPGSWSLGAGVGYAIYGLTGASTGSLGTLPATPTVAASLERAVAPGWWLVLGAAGTASRSRTDATIGTYNRSRDDASSVAVSAGVRRALTRPGAPVTVSADVLASVGYAFQRMDVAGVSPYVQRSEAFGVGLIAGLAVERELTAGLSLRVATPLVGVAWSRSRVEDAAAGDASGREASASFLLAPSLSLRLAF